MVQTTLNLFFLGPLLSYLRVFQSSEPTADSADAGGGLLLSAREQQ